MFMEPINHDPNFTIGIDQPDVFELQWTAVASAIHKSVVHVVMVHIIVGQQVYRMIGDIH